MRRTIKKKAPGFVKLNNQTLLHYTLIILLVTLLLACFSCETDLERRVRLERERQEQVELDKRIAKQAIKQEKIDEEQRRKKELKKERERLRREKEEQKLAHEQAQRAEIERVKKVYGDYSLPNGELPWVNCFGKNARCDQWGCSEIVVNASDDNDVVVIIKQKNQVKKHAYIRSGQSYVFQMPNGVYQPFFYTGKGWYPNKVMNSNLCPTLLGGFIDGSVWTKDAVQNLNNQVLTYTLQPTVYGNATSITASNEGEAL